jgi:hypothetical protein
VTVTYTREAQSSFYFKGLTALILFNSLAIVSHPLASLEPWAKGRELLIDAPALAYRHVIGAVKWAMLRPEKLGVINMEQPSPAMLDAIAGETTRRLLRWFREHLLPLGFVRWVLVLDGIRPHLKMGRRVANVDDEDLDVQTRELVHHVHNAVTERACLSLAQAKWSMQHQPQPVIKVVRAVTEADAWLPWFQHKKPEQPSAILTTDRDLLTLGGINVLRLTDAHHTHVALCPSLGRCLEEFVPKPTDSNRDNSDDSGDDSGDDSDNHGPLAHVHKVQGLLAGFAQLHGCSSALTSALFDMAARLLTCLQPSDWLGTAQVSGLGLATLSDAVASVLSAQIRVQCEQRAEGKRKKADASASASGSCLLCVPNGAAGGPHGAAAPVDAPLCAGHQLLEEQVQLLHAVVDKLQRNRAVKIHCDTAELVARAYFVLCPWKCVPLADPHAGHMENMSLEHLPLSKFVTGHLFNLCGQAQLQVLLQGIFKPSVQVRANGHAMFQALGPLHIIAAAGNPSVPYWDRLAEVLLAADDGMWPASILLCTGSQDPASGAQPVTTEQFNLARRTKRVRIRRTQEALMADITAANLDASTTLAQLTRRRQKTGQAAQDAMWTVLHRLSTWELHLIGIPAYLDEGQFEGPIADADSLKKQARVALANVQGALRAAWEAAHPKPAQPGVADEGAQQHVATSSVEHNVQCFDGLLSTLLCPGLASSVVVGHGPRAPDEPGDTRPPGRRRGSRGSSQRATAAAAAAPESSSSLVWWRPLDVVDLGHDLWRRDLKRASPALLRAAVRQIARPKRERPTWLVITRVAEGRFKLEEANTWARAMDLASPTLPPPPAPLPTEDATETPKTRQGRSKGGKATRAKEDTSAIKVSAAACLARTPLESSAAGRDARTLINQTCTAWLDHLSCEQPPVYSYLDGLLGLFLMVKTAWTASGPARDRANALLAPCRSDVIYWSTVQDKVQAQGPVRSSARLRAKKVDAGDAEPGQESSAPATSPPPAPPSAEPASSSDQQPPDISEREGLQLVDLDKSDCHVMIRTVCRLAEAYLTNGGAAHLAGQFSGGALRWSQEDMLLLARVCDTATDSMPAKAEAARRLFVELRSNGKGMAVHTYVELYAKCRIGNLLTMLKQTGPADMQQTVQDLAWAATATPRDLLDAEAHLCQEAAKAQEAANVAEAAKTAETAQKPKPKKRRGSGAQATAMADGDGARVRQVPMPVGPLRSLMRQPEEVRLAALKKCAGATNEEAWCQKTREHLRLELDTSKRLQPSTVGGTAAVCFVLPRGAVALRPSWCRCCLATLTGSRWQTPSSLARLPRRPCTRGPQRCCRRCCSSD